MVLKKTAEESSGMEEDVVGGQALSLRAARF